MDEVIQQLLIHLNIPDAPTTDQIQESQQYIDEMFEQPSGIIYFLNAIAHAPNKRIRKAAIVNTYRLIRKSWIDIPKEVKENAENFYLEIINIPDLDHIELNILADGALIIFKACGFWNGLIRFIITSYSQQQHFISILFLSKIFPFIPENIVATYFSAFRNMAYAGLNFDDLDTCLNSCDICVYIANATQDITIAEPVIQFVLGEIENCASLQQEDFVRLWGTIRKIFTINGISNDSINGIISLALPLLQSSELEDTSQILILESFSSLIDKIDFETATTFFELSFNIAIQFIEMNQNLPNDVLCLIEKGLTNRAQEEMCSLLKTRVTELLNTQTATNVTLALCVLRLLLQYASSSMTSEISFVQSVLISALQSQDPLIQCAALQIISIIDECSEEFSQMVSDLIMPVANILVTDSSTVRTQAYHSFITLCELCDTYIEGLFELIWKLQIDGLVIEENLDNYIIILSDIIRLCKNLSDEQVQQIISFLDVILNSEADISHQSGALSIVTSLFTVNEELSSELFPKVIPLLPSFLNYQNQDVICQALLFLRNTSKFYKQGCLDSIQQFIPMIELIMKNSEKEDRVFLTALDAAAQITKCCKDDSLLSVICNSCKYLIETTNVQLIQEGCIVVGIIAKSLRVSDENTTEEYGIKSSNSKAFFDGIISIVMQETDIDLLEASMEALSNLFNKCYLNDQNYFVTRATDLLIHIINGQIEYFHNSSPIQSDAPTEFIQYLIDYASSVLCVRPPNFSEICELLLQWLTNAEPLVASTILCVFIDLLEINTIENAILIKVVEYIKEIIQNIQEVTYQQNVTFFIKTLIKKLPSELPLIQSFLPTIDQWYTEASSKITGSQVFLSNIASLYCQILTIDNISPERIVSAMRYYPPADEKETLDMTECIMKLLLSSLDQNLLFTILIAVTNLLCEPQTMITRRKIPNDMYQQVQALYKHVLTENGDLLNRILGNYSNSQQKQQIIMQFVS